MKKIKLYNSNLELNLINLNEYNKIDLDKQTEFRENNKENLENFNKLLELDFLIENKKDIKENKEKRKILINENLNNKFFNIYHLEKFIDYLDKNNKRIINDKKNINKLGKDLNLQDKSIYENIINYFILLFLDKDYFLNLDFLNKKIKNEFSKKELKELNEINSFSFKELKSNFLENFNNKFIVDYIKEYEGITKKSSFNLDLILELLEDKEENKEEYKFNLNLLKKNNLDLEKYKEYKSKIYKGYQKKENKLNMDLKRKSFKLKSKYNIFYTELLENKIDLDKLKKLVYKKKILEYKNNLFYKNNKESYKENINQKNIRYLKYLDKNLDLDLDKDKRYKSFKLLLDYKIK